MNIKPLEVDAKIDNIKFQIIPDNTYNLMKKVFRINRPKPKNKYELLKLYVSIIKNTTINDFVISKQIRDDTEKKT